MKFLGRQIDLCMACMETHVVYKIDTSGDFFGDWCWYCYKTDSFMWEL